MFEGKPPRSDEASPAGSNVERDALRPIEWAELASRLAAARDLRASLASESGGEASFDAGSARRIAARRDGKDRVNLEDLADRKVVGSSEPEALLAKRRGAVRDR